MFCVVRGPYCMHSAYSAPHARETHAGWQCADRRKVNNRNNALYTHFTSTLHTNYTHKTHISISGGEINTIQTYQKTLVRVIRRGVSFSVRPPRGAAGAPRRTDGKRHPLTDNTAQVSRPVSIVYVFLLRLMKNVVYNYL